MQLKNTYLDRVRVLIETLEANPGVRAAELDDLQPETVSWLADYLGYAATPRRGYRAGWVLRKLLNVDVAFGSMTTKTIRRTRHKAMSFHVYFVETARAYQGSGVTVALPPGGPGTEHLERCVALFREAYNAHYTQLCGELAALNRAEEQREKDEERREAVHAQTAHLRPDDAALVRLLAERLADPRIANAVAHVLARDETGR